MRTLIGASVSLSVLLVAGCNVFDSELEALIPSDDAVGALADACSADLPLMQSAKDPVLYDTGKLTNRRGEVGSCSIESAVLSGADAFFKVQANAGERWHFHVDGLADQDLAIYVSSSESCDDRLCISAADVCGPFRSEHFTFIPETGGTFIIGVDGIDASAGEPLSLLAINPVCGDGNKEHSEVCDDKNVTSGDGCDRHCRTELSEASNTEVEPNDDGYGANVLIPQSGAITVQAKLGGTVCQPDVYIVNVPTTQVFSAVVLDIAGKPCTSAPPIALDVIQADADDLRETIPRGSDEGSDGSCPEVTMTLAAGSYFLKLTSLAGEVGEETGYQLRVTLSDP